MGHGEASNEAMEDLFILTARRLFCKQAQGRLQENFIFLLQPSAFSPQSGEVNLQANVCTCLLTTLAIPFSNVE